MSRWNHLMCAACWNADEGNIARSVNTAVEGANSNSFQFPDVTAGNCCYVARGEDYDTVDFDDSV